MEKVLEYEAENAVWDSGRTAVVSELQEGRASPGPHHVNGSAVDRGIFSAQLENHIQLGAHENRIRRWRL